MRCLTYLLIAVGIVSSTAPAYSVSPEQNTEPGAGVFTPPSGWRFADSLSLPKNMVMVVGQSQHEMPPSINLSTDRYSGTLKDYLKIVKAINEAQGSEWKDLGTIRTEAGEASLSQIDMKTSWGDIREMHVILLKNGIVYILTAAALKEEFPKFYKDFFRAMRSLRINKDVYEMIADPKKRASLQKSLADLSQAWDALQKKRESSPDLPREIAVEEAFDDREFQEKHWIPFTIMLEQQFNDMEATWREFLLVKTKSELIAK